jgi:hypothetical protein
MWSPRLFFSGGHAFKADGSGGRIVVPWPTLPTIFFLPLQSEAWVVIFQKKKCGLGSNQLKKNFF